VALLTEHTSDLGATVPVIAESSWLILDRLGTEAHGRFLGLVTGRELQRVDLTDVDWARVEELCGQYTDLRLDAIDASIVAVAERLGVGTIATSNYRDFRVVRPRHVDSFELLPGWRR
jgi:uncharacterized protein